MTVEKRQIYNEVPFKSLSLLYLFCYYDDEETERLYGSPTLVDFAFEKDYVSFASISKDSDQIIQKIKEFTLAPILCQIDENDKIYWPILETNVAYDPSPNLYTKADFVNAPYLKTLPIVFECKFNNSPSDRVEANQIVHQYKAKIVNTTVLRAGLCKNGEFDIISAWSELDWTCIS